MTPEAQARELREAVMRYAADGIEDRADVELAAALRKAEADGYRRGVEDAAEVAREHLQWVAPADKVQAVAEDNRAIVRLGDAIRALLKGGDQ